MKKVFAISFVITLFIAACTNSNQVSQEKQDSLEAAAAADSMLREAAKEDTTSVDKMAADTSDTDSL